MIEIIECKEIEDATPEEIENLEKNGFFSCKNVPEKRGEKEGFGNK